MGLALERGARGSPSPNPHVGAVVVHGDEVVGLGHHERAGEDHAEISALREAGDRAGGATLYITLEPCNHVGRTPPCTDAILGVPTRARVVIGCVDPNPHVAGGGAEKLRAAGLTVEVGCREADAKRLIAPWTKFVTTGVPYVTLKLALSLDGRIASRTGASKWVTGPEARARVHQLRSQNDAVMIGIGTALADDPRLTVRDAPGHSPLRVILDTKLRLPLTSRLVQSAREVPTWVICTTDASSTAGRGAHRTRCGGSPGAAVRRRADRAAGGAEDARVTRDRLGDDRGRSGARGKRAGRGGRRRAALFHRADPAWSSRQTGGGRLGRPGDPGGGSLHQRSAMGGLRGRRARVGVAPVRAAVETSRALHGSPPRSGGGPTRPKRPVRSVGGRPARPKRPPRSVGRRPAEKRKNVL